MTSNRWIAILSGVLLVVIIAVAFWLRWRYIHDISLYVDEFTTLWAATRVQELGSPRMPSGVLYTRGLLNSYFEAAWLGLLGFNYVNGRLLSLLFGLATVLATVFVGRNEWTMRVGLLAALGLALLPEAIIWGGRARFYTQLQFFSLLTAWCAFIAIRSKNQRQEVLGLAGFALFFVLALFSQEETLLLYPVVLLAMLVWRGWRYLLRPAVLLCHAACLAAIGLRYAIEILGQPGYFETIQSTRPYVGLIFDVVGAWRVYGPLVVSPERLAWTIFALLAVIVATLGLRNSEWRLLNLTRFDQASLFFAGLFVSVYIVLLLLVGTSWREARYLLFIQPFWLLLGAAGLVWLIDRLTDRESLRWVISTGIGLVLALILWPSAQSVLAQQTEGYDLVLDAVAEQRQEGDVFLSPQPPACALVLGPCDYYAVQRGYEEFVIANADDGALVDRWSGAELLSETDELETLLRNGNRVWLITDAFRLATRYESDFVRTVLEQFDVAIDERGVLALLAEGWRQPQTPVAFESLDDPAIIGPLALVGWEQSEFTLGTPLDVTLLWESTSPIDTQLNTSLQLVAEDGSRLVQSDGPPARGILPANLIFDQPVPDFKRLDIPSDLVSGRYRLELSVYDVETTTPLAEPLPIVWFRVGPAPVSPDERVGITWDEPIALVGLDNLPKTVKPGELFDVRLVWEVTGDVDDDYTAFLHWVDDEGVPIAQIDTQPGGAFYPSSAMIIGDSIESIYPLSVPVDAPAGLYRLIVGLYLPETGQRLPVEGDDHLELGQIEILP